MDDSVHQRASDVVIAEMQKDIKFLIAGQDEMKKMFETLATSIDKKYVSKEAFKPVQSIVYGMVGVILTAILGALLTLIIIR